MIMHGRQLGLRGMCAALALAAISAEADTPRLPTIVITAPTTTEPDAPFTASTLDAARIQNAQPLIDLSETLVAVPGVIANNRRNYAQDVQISIRGFGARSTFGVRGIRLYVDGIPATMPDGQGQVSHFDLASARHIEVIRGSYSALYGNAAGGVINIATEDGPSRTTLTPRIEYGSHATSRTGLKFGGQSGRADYVVSGSHVVTGGFREHSGAQRTLTRAKLRFTLNNRATLSLMTDYLDAQADDPLGLDRRQLAQDRTQAGNNALAYDSRKRYTHGSVGVMYDTALGARDTLRVMTYVGDRQVRQFLALPEAAQRSATSAGGVIDLDRQFGGMDLRWTRQFLPRALTLTAGLSYDTLQEARKGYNNFDGDRRGVVGALRRDERNHVFNLDQYLQVEDRLADKWSVTLGLRNSHIVFSSKDRFLANGNDSGSIEYGRVNASAGLLYRARPALDLYVNAGRGIETPTFNELAYRLSGPGLNLELRPARTTQAEVGAKLRLGRAARAELAVFAANVHDDLAVAQNAGGRAVFRNVGKTRRQGMELSFRSEPIAGFAASLAYTYLDAQFGEAYLTCAATPCVFPDTHTATVAAGNALPGTPKHHLYAELAWRDARERITTAFELRSVGRVYANDLNTDHAAGYTAVNWRVQLEQKRGRIALREFARIDNLFDRRHIASLIVNEANGRYYEPAPGRGYLLGAALEYAF